MHVNPERSTAADIQELVSFLPRLYAEGVSPVERWEGGVKGEDGSVTLPWPLYNKVVEEFFRVAARQCWMDRDYQPVEAGQMLADEEVVRKADMTQIRQMLTYCVRGERFCDGHRGAMITGGHIRRLLQRIAELASDDV